MARIPQWQLQREVQIKMTDELLYDLGVDLNSSLRFVDGDIVLSNYKDNLVQAVVNRLNTDLDELSLFYNDYGSIMNSFFGWRTRDETLGFVKSELETVLQKEARLVSWNYDVNYSDGALVINLVLNPSLDYDISVTLNLTEDGVEVVE